MDTIRIANTASNISMLHVQSEATFRVMKMVMDSYEEEGDGLLKMIDAAMTGIGQNLDMLV